MVIIITALISYFVINMLGGIYEIFLDRDDISDEVRRTLNQVGIKIGQEYRIQPYHMIIFTIVALSMYSLMWAPEKFTRTLKNEG